MGFGHCVWVNAPVRIHHTTIPKEEATRTKVDNRSTKCLGNQQEADTIITWRERESEKESERDTHTHMSFLNRQEQEKPLSGMHAAEPIQLSLHLTSFETQF